MKGDINLKISKKGLLIFSTIIGFFAMADYVSVIDAKSSGGVIVDGLSEQEIADLIAQGISDSMPIGSVTIRLDSVNPNSLYGGTWQLITGDASLRLGSGNALTGNIKGSSNNQSVPLVSHNHSYQKTTNFQVSVANYGWDTTVTIPDNGWSSYIGTGNSSGTRVSGRLKNTTTTTNNQGMASPTMDVRGQYVEVNVWKRIS